MAEQSDRSVLAVNVGNGLTRFGVFSRGEVVGAWTASTPGQLTVDEARSQARAVVSELLGGAEPDGAILSCVVPSHTDVWTQALTSVSKTRALVVGPGLKSGVRMRQDDPSGVGSDRVANIAAARATYGAPVVVVSLGTTTNIEVVDAAGSFVGGIISPGLMLGVRGLASAAARLPMVELHAPSSVVGRNTRDAMQSGVVLGEAARIDGLLDRVFEELGSNAPVIITGSHAELVSSIMRHETTFDEMLTLRGLAGIWYANMGHKSRG